jgi:hypothetical protein
MVQLADVAESPAPSPDAPHARPGDLLELARFLAAEPGLTDRLVAGTAERTWLSLPSGPGMVAWLIAWPPGTGTGWHDHGDAAGAMVIVEGELTERSTEAPADHDYSQSLPLLDENGRVRQFAAGQGRAFTPQHVHEVTNDGAVTAYSVHVYSPELALMRRYVPSGGALLPIGTEIAGDW